MKQFPDRSKLPPGLPGRFTVLGEGGFYRPIFVAFHLLLYLKNWGFLLEKFVNILMRCQRGEPRRTRIGSELV